MMNQSTDTPLLFYSRRIGLNQVQGVGREVPISAGARLTGRSGRYSIGLLDIGTRDEPTARAVATNFAVVRVKRDILRRSSIGAIATSRSTAQNLSGSNEAYGVDGSFAFYENLFFNTYWARTRSDGVTNDDSSFRAQMEYAGDRYGLQLERLNVGDNFNPEVGFVRRDNMRRNYAQLRFSPRPRSIPSVRKFLGIGTLTYIENGAGQLETRTIDSEFAIEFQNSDRFSVGLLDSYEFLQRPFLIAPGVVIPTGGYGFTTGRIVHNFGQQRPVSGNLSLEHGTFYDGHITTFSFTRTRVNPAARFSMEPTISLNWVDLPYGSFTTKLIGSRVTYTMTPMMFTSALIQYNSSTNRVSANVRLRWEYRPGSELFVVYNEERDTFTPRFPDLQNRALIVKINRLFRF
jgi:hypothetical protein